MFISRLKYFSDFCTYRSKKFKALYKITWSTTYVLQTTPSFLRQPLALLTCLLLPSWLRAVDQAFPFTKKASPLVFTKQTFI